jgi:DNA-binding XRE family transcriptional regulator
MNAKKTDADLTDKFKDPHFKELYDLEMQKVELVKPIIAYRVKHKLNQSQLAKKIGVSQQHISKIENGNFSNMNTLEKVLRFIGYTFYVKAIPLKQVA